MELPKKLKNQLCTGIFLILLLAFPQHAHSQTLDLKSCLNRAVELSPQKRQQNYLASIKTLNQEVINSNYLPDIQFQGQASYQSDVFSLPFTSPGSGDIPAIPKDQYRFSLNINQKIYDGGITNASNQIMEADHQIQSAQLEASLYKIDLLINELYFGILEIRENQRITGTILSELDNQLKRAHSAVTNGVLLPGELKSLQKERLMLLQKQNNVQLTEQALLKALSDWIGLEINQETTLQLPVIMEVKPSINRPELSVFDSQMKKLEANKVLVTAENRPKIAGFISAGYGSPNPYNFFEVDWNPFYMVGGRLEWTLWDWKKSRNKQEVLDLNQLVIQSEKEHFEKSIRNELTQMESKIASLEQSVKTDLQLLELQQEIMTAASAQFEHGTISATEYLSELNDLTQVELHYQLNKIHLVKTKIQYQTIAGNNP